jgi:hypothetical protein
MVDDLISPDEPYVPSPTFYDSESLLPVTNKWWVRFEVRGCIFYTCAPFDSETKCRITEDWIEHGLRGFIWENRDLPRAGKNK